MFRLRPCVPFVLLLYFCPKEFLLTVSKKLSWPPILISTIASRYVYRSFKEFLLWTGFESPEDAEFYDFFYIYIYMHYFFYVEGKCRSCFLLLMQIKYLVTRGNFLDIFPREIRPRFYLQCIQLSYRLFLCASQLHDRTDFAFLTNNDGAWLIYR